MNCKTIFAFCVAGARKLTYRTGDCNGTALDRTGKTWWILVFFGEIAMQWWEFRGPASQFKHSDGEVVKVSQLKLSLFSFHELVIWEEVLVWSVVVWRCWVSWQVEVFEVIHIRTPTWVHCCVGCLQNFLLSLTLKFQCWDVFAQSLFHNQHWNWEVGGWTHGLSEICIAGAKTKVPKLEGTGDCDDLSRAPADQKKIETLSSDIWHLAPISVVKLGFEGSKGARIVQSQAPQVRSQNIIKGFGFTWEWPWWRGREWRLKKIEERTETREQRLENREWTYLQNPAEEISASGWFPRGFPSQKKISAELGKIRAMKGISVVFRNFRGTPTYEGLHDVPWVLSKYCWASDWSFKNPPSAATTLMIVVLDRPASSRLHAPKHL